VWIIIGVALVGCEHGQVPGLVARNPQLVISNVQQPVDPQSPSGPSQVRVQVEVIDDTCTPLAASFGGTYRGAPMTVVSRGNVNGDVGFCERPLLAIDPLTVTPADDVITIFDDTASISATLDPAALDARSIDLDTVALINNATLDIRWSHPDDLATSSLVMTFRETFLGDCRDSDCFGEQFSVFGSVNGTDPSVVSFTPFFSTGVQNGEVQIRAGSTTGQVECDGQSCTFELEHMVVVPATATL